MFEIEITDKYFGLKETQLQNPRTRLGARGVVEDKNGNIAIFNKSFKNEYKLPGGGIEENEDKYTSFAREVMEEVGCTIKDVEFVGTVKEIESKENFVQESYVFFAKVDKLTSTLHLTEKEQEEGARLLWLNPIRALRTMQDCLTQLKESKYDNIYRSKFMVVRDIEILKKYLDSNKKF